MELKTFAVPVSREDGKLEGILCCYFPDKQNEVDREFAG